VTELPAGLPDRMPRTMAELKALARQLGVPKKALLVLAEGNDPFNADTPAKRRDAEWFVDLWHRFGYSHGIYLHQMHYRAQATGDVITPSSKKVYENTEACEQVLIRAAINARHLGLCDPERIIDKRSEPTRMNVVTPELYWIEPEPVEPSWNISLGPAMPWSPPTIGDFHVPRWYGDQVEAGDIEPAVIDDIGDIDVSGYDYHGRAGFLFEFWIEKDSMSRILEPLCRALGVNYTAGDGFSSHVRIVEMLKRAQAHRRPIRLITLSDFDPGGLGMPVAFARNIEFYRDKYAPDIEFVHHHIGMGADCK
jgi:hypothetical protein